MKSSGDLVGLFDLFSVNKFHAFSDLGQVFAGGLSEVSVAGCTGRFNLPKICFFGGIDGENVLRLHIFKHLNYMGL